MFEADIAACFDEISHAVLMDRVRARVADKRVLHLVKAFLRAGILTEDGQSRQTITGTPQGSLCEASHNDPYEQRRIMPSAGLFFLVRGGPVVERCA